MSYQRNKVEDTKRKLDMGLRVYNGRKMTPELNKDIVEIIGNCIKDLSWDEFCVLKTESPEHMINFLDEARAKVKRSKINVQISQVGATLPDLPGEETPEEKQERLHRAQVNFFFPKNKAMAKCDCGAAYTQFPHIHASYCSVHKQHSSNIDHTPKFFD